MQLEEKTVFCFVMILFYNMFIIKMFLLLTPLPVSLGSAGDSSKFFSYCVFDCLKDNNCTKEPIASLPLWSCKGNCEYSCQWSTVEAFLKRGWAVPQFHGKWPFIRMFGLQEPASAFFSVANLWVVFKCWKRFRVEAPSDGPYYWLWNMYSLVSQNCWIWSTIYHAYDTDVTEKMDYISASLLVFAAFYSMTVRTLQLKLSAKSIIWSVVCACIVARHCSYLWFSPFDYSYNMMFNVTVGSVAVAGWLIWAAVAIKLEHPCPRTIAGYCVLMATATMLELIDFPPLLWCFDAHALWHLSTCFIVPLFYSFIRQDSIYLKAIADYKLPMGSKAD